MNLGPTEVIAKVEKNLGVDLLKEFDKAVKQIEEESNPFSDADFIKKGDIVITKGGDGYCFLAVLVDERLILATLNPNTGKKHDLKAINSYNAHLDQNRVYLSDLKQRLTSFKDAVIIDKDDVDHLEFVLKG